MLRLSVLTLTAALLWATAAPAQKKAEQKEDPKAVETFTKLGARIERADEKPGKPIAWMVLENTKVKDADLAHVKGLPHLEVLDLTRTQITDVGLAHLKGHGLKQLYLVETKISDAGLKHLKEVKGLATLELMGTTVTDAGLEHLKGISSLRKLGVQKTKVTKKGIESLEAANQLLSIREE